MMESARYAMRIKAHIPTQQYGFIEIGGKLEDKAEIERLYNEYAESPIAFKGGLTVRLKDFFGNEIDYDAANHVYSWNGEIYESGSQYAKRFEKPFDKVNIAAKMAHKYGVKAEDIIAMWELNARVSREFGTALHSALELYGVHKDLAIALERDSALHSHPVIKYAVETFYKGREKEVAHYEVFVVDHKNKRAGQIDRLLVNGENDYTVQDYKTGAELKPDKQLVYFKQLDFYGEIIEANGGKVRPPQLFHYDGSWHTINKGGDDAPKL